MKLEAKEPSCRGLAPLANSFKNLMVVDSGIVAEGKFGRVDEGDAAAPALEGA